MKTSMGLLVASALALTACGNKEDKAAPTGQVVATLDGQEITVADVQAEVGDNGQSANPNVQSQALQRIVARKLLAAEAKRRELDTTPLGSILKRRAEEDALAQLLSRKVMEGAPQISENEVQDFLRTYPASVTQRKILNVDSLLVPKVAPEVVEQLKGLHSIEEAVALLNSRNVKFQRTGSVLDTLTLEPTFAARLVETEGTDIFIVPEGNAVQIGKITSSRVEPLAGNDARNAARAILVRKRNTDLMNQTLAKIVQDGQKRVKMNPAYQGKQVAGAAKP